MSSDKKYVVPDGMRIAAGGNTGGVDPEGYILYLGLQGAIKWLSENPQMPTIKQLEEMWNQIPESTANYPYWQKVREVMAEWQRRMFLAPEPPKSFPDPLVMHIMRHFEDVEHDERTRRHRAECAIADYAYDVKQRRDEGR